MLYIYIYRKRFGHLFIRFRYVSMYVGTSVQSMNFGATLILTLSCTQVSNQDTALALMACAVFLAHSAACTRNKLPMSFRKVDWLVVWYKKQSVIGINIPW